MPAHRVSHKVIHKVIHSLLINYTRVIWLHFVGGTQNVKLYAMLIL
jgi:hypothetical protein